MGTEGVSSVDEVWGIPAGKEGSPEFGDLFVKVCCRTEDIACGVSADAESLLDGRKTKLQDETGKERGELGHTPSD